jgi:Family of unknown function (DUF6491)
MTTRPSGQRARWGAITMAHAAMTCAMLLASSGCATSAEPGKSNPSLSQEDCMFSVVVKDWASIDQERFIIYGLSRHDPYLAKLFFPTPDLVNNVRMLVVDEDHNGRICGQSGDWVQFQNPTIPGRNLITSLRKITDEEAKLLLAESSKKKPKEKQGSKEQKAPAQPGQAQ